jgi:hypothetical protein
MGNSPFNSGNQEISSYFFLVFPMLNIDEALINLPTRFTPSQNQIAYLKKNKSLYTLLHLSFLQVVNNTPHVQSLCGNTWDADEFILFYQG